MKRFSASGHITSEAGRADDSFQGETMRDHDELLRRFLLDKLEDEERSLLEERLLREEDLLELAEAIEADLLDDYAHDRLAPEEREQVAQRLASSPQGRLRLALIRGLVEIANEIPNEKNGRVLPFLKKVISRPEIRAAVAVAATLVIAVNLHHWIPVPPVPPSSEPEKVFHQAWNPPAPSDWIHDEEPDGETRIATEPAPPPAAPLVIQLALSTLRGEEEIPIVNVPPGTERVQLHILLDEADKDPYESFQAVVRGEGPERQVSGLEPGKIEGRWTLVLDLDSKLPDGPYEVEVSGVNAAGDVEYLTTKELEITRNASADAGTPD